MNAAGQEFTSARLIEVVGATRHLPPQQIVDSVFDAVATWRGETPPNDDMTAVAVKITA
jgi:serine phosphatase RsbU (regulator of sigma subunit)